MKATLAGIAVVSLAYLVFAIDRRWISDDGLIYTRVVRNILDGNGPVFNASERTEANTSALWPWMIALLSAVTTWDPAPAAVWLGIVCSVAGLAIGMDGTRRWHRHRGSDAMLVPGSALMVLGVWPFWDFASSGLENGLCMLWIGASWWLLVDVTTRAPSRRDFAAAVVFGLGPLCRPDLAVATLAWVAACWWLVRPPRRRAIALAASALALPVAFEIFRAGYYGALVPLPALAKSAADAQWSRGLDYVLNFALPYWLWWPAAALVVLAVLAHRKGRIAARDRVLVAAPLAAAAVLCLYLLRVGGDFMHGRLCLPFAFLAALPGLVLPLRRFTAPALAALAVWAVISGTAMFRKRTDTLGYYVNDERNGYVRWTRTRNPTTSDAYTTALGVSRERVEAILRDGTHRLIAENGMSFPLAAHRREPVVFVAGRLGAGGALTPLDAITADNLGLANPIGARITLTYPEGPPGHEKPLPPAWHYAEYGDPAADDPKLAPSIAAARRAMTCGAIAELLASVREPMSPGRFWDNLVGAFRRTRMVIPAEPIDAEREFCGP